MAAHSSPMIKARDDLAARRSNANIIDDLSPSPFSITKGRLLGVAARKIRDEMLQMESETSDACALRQMTVNECYATGESDIRQAAAHLQGSNGGAVGCKWHRT